MTENKMIEEDFSQNQEEKQIITEEEKTSDDAALHSAESKAIAYKGINGEGL